MTSGGTTRSKLTDAVAGLPPSLDPNLHSLENALSAIATLEDALRQARVRAEIAEARARRFEEVLRFAQWQLASSRRKPAPLPPTPMPAWAPALMTLLGGMALLILIQL